MRRKALLAPLLLVIIAMVAVPAPGPVVHGSPDRFEIIDTWWSTSAGAKLVEVAPGDEAVLHIALRYLGLLPASDVVVNTSLPKGLVVVGTGSSENSTSFRGPLKRGSVITVSIPVYISRSVEPGNYSISLTVQYYTPRSGKNLEELECVVEVSGRPSVVVRSLTPSIPVGTSVVLLEVANEGSASAEEVYVRLDSSTQGVSIVNGSVLIEQLEPNESRVIRVAVTTPPYSQPTPIRLRAQYSYRSAKGIGYAGENSIELYAQPQYPRLSIGINNTIVGPGATCISIAVRNLGDSGVRNLTLYLEAQNPLHLCSPTRVYLGALDPNSSAVANALLCPLPVAGISRAVLRIEASYLDEYGVEHSETQSFDLYILPPLRTPLLVNATVPTLSPGEEGVVELTVENRGSGAVENLCIYPSSSSLQVLGQVPACITELGPGSHTVFTVRIAAPRNPGTYVLSTELRYIDPETGSEESLHFSTSVRVEEPRTAVIVELTPTRVIGGRVSLLTLRIVNVGEAELSDVYAVLDAKTIQLLNISRFEIGAVAPGRGAEVTIAVKAPSVQADTVGSLTVSLYWKTPWGTSGASTYTVPIYVSAPLPEKVVDVYVEPSTLEAYSFVKLRVVIRNTGSESVRNIVVELKSLEPLKPMRSIGSVTLGNLAPGETRVIEVPVAVPDAPGIHQLSLRVSYLDSYGGEHSYSVELVVAVVQRVPKLTIRAEPQELRSPSVSTVMLRVVNEGGVPIKGVVLRIQPSDVLGVANSTPISIGDLEPGRAAEIPVTLYVPRVSEVRISRLTVVATYLDPLGGEHSDTRYIYLRILPPEPTVGISVKPLVNELTIGKASRLCIEVRNNGTHTLKGLSIDVEPSQVGVVLGTPRFFIDVLRGGEAKRLCLEVYVPANVGASTMRVTVSGSYLDEDLGATQSFTDRFSVLLRGHIELSLVDFAVIPEKPSPGQPFSITITVTNVGTSTAYAAYAVPKLEGLPLRVFGPRSTFIGNIEVNAPTTFTINLLLMNTSQRRLVLPVTVMYMDNLRTLHSKTFNIPIELAPPSRGGKLSGSIPRRAAGSEGFSAQLVIAVGVAVAVAAVAGTVYIYRRR